MVVVSLGMLVLTVFLPGCRGTLPFASTLEKANAQNADFDEDIEQIEPLFSVVNFTPELRGAYRLLFAPATRETVPVQPSRVNVRLWAVSESAWERLGDDTTIGDSVTRDPFVELSGTGGVRLAFLNPVDTWFLEEALSGDVYSTQIHGTFLELEPSRPNTDTPGQWSQERFDVVRRDPEMDNGYSVATKRHSGPYTATPIVPVFTAQGGAANDGTIALNRLRIELPVFSLRENHSVQDRQYRNGLTKYTIHREAPRVTVPPVELPALHIPPGATLLVRIPGEVEVVTTGSHPLMSIATRRRTESGDFLILISDRDLSPMPSPEPPPTNP